MNRCLKCDVGATCPCNYSRSEFCLIVVNIFNIEGGKLTEDAVEIYSREP